MIPSSSWIGVKFTELTASAVSQGTCRRTTCFSNREGMPYGRASTPSPSSCAHGWTSVIAGSDAEATLVREAASAPLAASVPIMNRRRC